MLTERPRLLDAFCGAGGATRGYQLAGFHVTGVDIRPQPRYVGDGFMQGDAIAFIREHGHEYDAIHASPPCQAYSDLAALHRDREYPQLIEPTRAALRQIGVPYVIENVDRAPLREPLLLCGAMFPALRVYRHRLFESSVAMFGLLHPQHREPTDGHRGYKGAKWTGFVTVTGGGNTTFANQQRAMGIGWMIRDELNEAIPPAYTAFVGIQLRRYLESGR